jgi:hypothetical protein
MDAARRAVWIALSNLFLDTDVRLIYANTARVCAASPFSQEELERIFHEEVAPVVEPNLHAVAGEWAGFDEEWLVTAISARTPGRGWRESRATNDFRAVALLVERLRALPPELHSERIEA